MVGLVIKGCEFDPAQVKDVVFGDSFRMELDKAIELAEAGVEFWAAGPNETMARVILGQNEYGERILRTEPNAWAANHQGEISAPPVIHRPYRAETHVPARMNTAYAVAA